MIATAGRDATAQAAAPAPSVGQISYVLVTPARNEMRRREQRQRLRAFFRPSRSAS